MLFLYPYIQEKFVLFFVLVSIDKCMPCLIHLILWSAYITTPLQVTKTGIVLFDMLISVSFIFLFV